MISSPWSNNVKIYSFQMLQIDLKTLSDFFTMVKENLKIQSIRMRKIDFKT